MNVELKYLVVFPGRRPALARRGMAAGRLSPHLPEDATPRDGMPHLIVLFAFAMLALVATCALVG